MIESINQRPKIYIANTSKHFISYTFLTYLWSTVAPSHDVVLFFQVQLQKMVQDVVNIGESLQGIDGGMVEDSEMLGIRWDSDSACLNL